MGRTTFFFRGFSHGFPPCFPLVLGVNPLGFPLAPPGIELISAAIASNAGGHQAATPTGGGAMGGRVEGSGCSSFGGGGIPWIIWL